MKISSIKTYVESLGYFYAVVSIVHLVRYWDAATGSEILKFDVLVFTVLFLALGLLNYYLRFRNRAEDVRS